MTTIVALSLAGMYTGLKSIHDKNEEVYNKKAILSAVADKIQNDISTDEAVDIEFKKMDGFVLNATGDVVEKGSEAAQGIEMRKEEKKPLKERLYPLFVYNTGSEKIYIATVRGKGLWDAIWAYVAIDSDGNNISGIAFDHQAETPGLGAEIKDNADFPASFKGRKLLNSEGEFTSVAVMKGGVKVPDHQVDGITGATMTCDGVTEMMKRGLEPYHLYFQSK